MVLMVKNGMVSGKIIRKNQESDLLSMIFFD